MQRRWHGDGVRGKQLNGMSTKEILQKVAEKLPPDATLADAIYELEFRQAVEQGHSARRELVHLATHGLLHLAGWRDDKEADRRAMEDCTVRLLDRAGVS